MANVQSNCFFFTFGSGHPTANKTPFSLRYYKFQNVRNNNLKTCFLFSFLISLQLENDHFINNKNIFQFHLNICTASITL